MSYNLGLKGKIRSEKLDLTPPDEILKSLCDEIREETDGEIEGVVLPYGGRMKSYTRKGGMLGYTQDEEVNIQDSLGAVGNKISRFEFCLATPIYKDFRYRLMLVEYDLAVYPATVVLESDIANQLPQYGNGYIYSFKSRKDFQIFLVDVINSDKAVTILQQLINLAGNAMHLEMNEEAETNAGV